MKKEMPDLEARIESGDLASLLGWLRKNIHAPGAIYRPGELVQRVTGEPRPAAFHRLPQREVLCGLWILAPWPPLRRDWWADPYLWSMARPSSPASPEGRVSAPFGDPRRRPRRIARAIAYLSLGILALTALFVFADKAALAEAWAGALLPSSLGALALGLCAGSLPLILGLPLAGIVLAALVLLNLGLEGWLPLRPGAGGRIRVDFGLGVGDREASALRSGKRILSGAARADSSAIPCPSLRK